MKRLLVEIAAAVVLFAGGWMAHERTHQLAAPAPNPLTERLSAARMVCDYVTAHNAVSRMMWGQDYCVEQMLDHGDLDRCMGAPVDSEQCVAAAVQALQPRKARAPAPPASAKRRTKTVSQGQSSATSSAQ